MVFADAVRDPVKPVFSDVGNFMVNVSNSLLLLLPVIGKFLFVF